MSNAEEPKAGQWWLRDDERVMLIAFDERTIGNECSCPIIAYRTPRCGKWYGVNRFVRRLPDDAGFDWKPEPEVVFPVWKAPNPDGLISVGYKKQLAYFRYDDAESGETFHKDGTSFRFSSGCLNHSHLITVTQAEAEARVVKRKSAEPDHEEWVTQDRVPARIGIDQEYWIRGADPIDWRDLAPIGPAAVSKMMHGQKDVFGDTLLLRCLRKHLPPFPEQPPQPNRIPVRLYWYDGNVVARYGHTPPTDPSFIEIKLDSERHISDSGFYVEGSLSQQ